ncbi:MAG: hypothetical protein NT143_02010 [Actinobacteria bacterium]|nr:hypothetical protein [Actinomycetota bacterium]
MSITLPTTPLPDSVDGVRAARRGLVAGAALLAALVAHAVAEGGLSIIPIAPALWIMLLAAAVVLGMRTGRSFRPRGAIVIFALLLVGQLALHAAMTYAPWAFGLDIHHAMPIVLGWGPVAVHLAAAVVLAVVIARAEILLAAAIRVAQAIIAPLRSRRPRGAAPLLASATLVVGRPPRGLHRSLPARGPPLPA